MNTVNIEKIYFDMDGVLANFKKGVQDYCGLTISEQSSKDDAFDDLMWGKIREVPHFYDKLEVIPGSLEMFNALYSKYGNKCEILSAVPKEKRNIPDASSDKEKWIRREISQDIKINLVYRKDKSNFAQNSGCILIDDFATNIAEWKEYGGTGILFTNPEDVIAEIQLLVK